MRGTQGLLCSPRQATAPCPPHPHKAHSGLSSDRHRASGSRARRQSCSRRTAVNTHGHAEPRSSDTLKLAVSSHAPPRPLCQVAGKSFYPRKEQKAKPLILQKAVTCLAGNQPTQQEKNVFHLPAKV